jgi:hypothetical protein
MTVWLKQGVLGDINRHIRLAINSVHTLCQQHSEDLFITSLRDGNHSAGSLHYDGCAFDCRKGELTRENVLRALSTLGPFYEVIDEVDHLHVEWDCK